MSPSGNQIPLANYMKEFQNELHFQNKVWQTITKRYEIPGGRLIYVQTNSSVNINEITFTGVLKKIDNSGKTRFVIVDQVWLIMKSLFEKRTFT